MFSRVSRRAAARLGDWARHSPAVARPPGTTILSARRRRPSLSFRPIMTATSASYANTTSPVLLPDRLVWLDCEMTGLDPSTDTLLELAVIITDGQLEMVAEGPTLVVHHPDAVLDAMGPWCTKTHADTGLTEAVRRSTKDMRTCEQELLAFVRQHTPAGKCPLAGNSVGQDAKFVAKYMPELMAHLHYRVVDVSTVKELARRWRPDLMKKVPKKNLTHRALDDIRESIDELKFYRQYFFVGGPEGGS